MVVNVRLISLFIVLLPMGLVLISELRFSRVNLLGKDLNDFFSSALLSFIWTAILGESKYDKILVFKLKILLTDWKYDI